MMDINNKFIKNLIRIDKLNNLIYIKAKGNATEFYFLDDHNNLTMFVQSRNIGYYEKIISKTANIFFRIHNSYIVNLSKIRNVNEDYLWLTLVDNETILPIHNNILNSFNEALIQNKHLNMNILHNQLQ